MSLKWILLMQVTIFLPFLCPACLYLVPSFLLLVLLLQWVGLSSNKISFPFHLGNRKFAAILISSSCKWISSAKEILCVPLTGITFRCEGFTILEKLCCQNWLFPHKQMQPLGHYEQRKAMQTDTEKINCLKYLDFSVKIGEFTTASFHCWIKLYSSRQWWIMGLKIITSWILSDTRHL